MYNAAYLIDAYIDLSNSLGLLFALLRDNTESLADLGSFLSYHAERISGFLGLFDAVLNTVNTLNDDGARLLRSVLGLGSEVLDLGCDNREALSCFTGSCSLNRSVEGENVCLERDILDHFIELCDLVGRFADVVHCLEQLVHLLAAVGNRSACFLSVALSLACILGILYYRGSYLVHGGTQFLNGIDLSGNAL